MSVNPVITNIATFAGTGANGQSAFVTFSFQNQTGYDAWIPIQMTLPNTVSAGAEVSVVRSVDGGVTYETELTSIMSFARQTGGTQTKDLVLRDRGTYLICVMVGGGGGVTYSVNFGATIELVTSYA